MTDDEKAQRVHAAMACPGWFYTRCDCIRLENARPAHRVIKVNEQTDLAITECTKCKRRNIFSIHVLKRYMADFDF